MPNDSLWLNWHYLKENLWCFRLLLNWWLELINRKVSWSCWVNMNERKNPVHKLLCFSHRFSPRTHSCWCQQLCGSHSRDLTSSQHMKCNEGWYSVFSWLRAFNWYNIKEWAGNLEKPARLWHNLKVTNWKNRTSPFSPLYKATPPKQIKRISTNRTIWHFKFFHFCPA